MVDDYFKLATCNIHYGTTASLWHDYWGFGILRQLFPQLFSFAKNKNATAQYFSQNDVATNFYTPLSPIAMQQRFLHVTWDMNMHIFDRIVQARRDFGRKCFREILIVAC
jgi:hypothetical protein